MEFNLSKLFTGTEQSRVAAIAIVCAVIAVVLSILLNNTDMDLTQRIGLVVFVVIFSLPSILLALFDLTCISGKTQYMSLCWIYGWFISAFIVIMSIIVIFSALMSMITYNEAIAKSNENVISSKDAENLAKDMMMNKDDVEKKQETPKVDMDMNGGYAGYAGFEGFANPLKKMKKKAEMNESESSEIVEGFVSGGEYSKAAFSNFQ